MRVKWTDTQVEGDLKILVDELGHMPSCSELRERGRNDLMCRITRTGGIMAWADKIGAKRIESDSDFGWEGEKCVKAILESHGFEVERTPRVKSPWDLIINNAVTVDVKTARYKTYGHCSGWFYRLGKQIATDVAILFQIDTQDCYIIPCKLLPMGNITITPTGKYTKFKNQFQALSQLVNRRRNEMQIWE